MEESRTASRGRESHKLGNYRLIAELGRGGMAEVFLAVASGPAGFNKLVVIKQIRPHFAEDTEALGMFLEEARLAARLSHPNVIQTNEVGQEGERYFIAMEYLDGQPLNRIIQRMQPSGHLSLAMHVKIIAEALAGLHHAHALTDYDGTPLGVVHRDVSPHNVLVTYDGTVKVVDFGIAKALNSSVETAAGVVKGKFAYMAPEQGRGDRVDRRADIFSVGVMLWEAATGRRMWKGVSQLRILERVLAGEIPTPRTINPDVPEALEGIILRALACRPADRYETAADLQMALERWLEGSGEHLRTRDIGRAIAVAFDRDRAQMRRIIEEQLRAKAQLDRSSAALLHLDPPTESLASGVREVGGRSTASTSDERPPPIKVEIVDAGSGRTSDLGPLLASPANAAGPAQEGKRRLFVAALAAGAMLAIALSLPVKSRAPAEAAPAVTTAAVPVAARVTTDVELRVVASPAEARILLDDRLLPGNPARVATTKDAGRHELRIEAAGYATRTEVITLERDRSVDITLAKDPPVTQPNSRAIDPMAPSGEKSLSPAKRKQRRLDTFNPYAQ